MPSLLDDDQQPQLGANTGVSSLLIQQPDPDKPDIGTGLGNLYDTVTAAIERQRKIAEDQGYWTGGGLLEGGHPTEKGLLDVGSQYGSSLLAGTITPGGAGATTGELLEQRLNPNAPGFADRISTRQPSVKNAPDVHSSADYLVGADSFNTALAPGKSGGPGYQDRTAGNVSWMPGFERFKQTPGLVENPGDVHDAFVGHIVDNLRALYDATDPSWRGGAMNWYDGANKLATDLAQMHGLEPRQGAGIYAALSPQKDWNENVEMGNRVAHVMSTAQDSSVSPKMQALWDTKYNEPNLFNSDGSLALDRKGNAKPNPDYKPGWSDDYANISGNNQDGSPKTLRQIVADRDANQTGLYIRLYDEAHNPTGNGTAVRVVKPDGSYGDTMSAPLRWNTNNFIGNAAHIYDDGSLENISQTLGSGHKVRNFYNNIVSPNAGSDVTIDTHAIAAANLMPWGSSRPEVAYGLGTSNPDKTQYLNAGWPTTPTAGATNGSLGLYPLYAEAYRQLAAEKGLLPRQVQSVTWEGIKGLFSDADRRNTDLINQHSDMWRAFENGDQSADDTRAQILRRGIKPPEWSR